MFIAVHNSNKQSGLWTVSHPAHMDCLHLDHDKWNGGSLQLIEQDLDHDHILLFDNVQNSNKY